MNLKLNQYSLSYVKKFCVVHVFCVGEVGVVHVFCVGEVGVVHVFCVGEVGVTNSCLRQYITQAGIHFHHLTH